MKSIFYLGIRILSVMFPLVLMVGGASKEVKRESNLNSKDSVYIFPSEELKHEGTWLTWPHSHTYGAEYAKEIEPIWVEMASALAPAEKVHIIAYDNSLKSHIETLLEHEGVNMKQIDFVVAPSDDSWVRDTGPMFVRSSNGQLKIIDFGFDGWGKKTPYKKDDKLPKIVARDRGYDIIDVPDFILEGGSIELDGYGTAMLTRSSVISKNRNPEMSQSEAEKYIRKYLGVNHFIWLDGVTDEDITDAHIDGFARFYGQNTILTVPEDDFLSLYEGIKESDYQTLLEAKTKNGISYDIKEIPLTKENVKGLDYKGSYLNFYIGNEVILLPVYGDVNDSVAIQKISELYPSRKVVPINVVTLYKHGGMIHCVTQQQPLELGGD